MDTTGESKRQTEQATGEINLHIYYEDTDFSGYVYHANYLKFFERGREHLIGIDFLKEMYEQGYHFVVRHIEMKFTRPACHGDHLKIVSQAYFTGSPVIKFKHTAYLHDHPFDPLVSADINIVGIDHAGKPKRLPKNVMMHLKGLSQEEH